MRHKHSLTWNIERNSQKRGEKFTLQDLEYGEKTETRAKLDTYTVRPGIWQETLK